MATASILPLSLISATATPLLPPIRPRSPRRRTTQRQGRALEIMGHAIEYLVDSRMVEGGASPADNRAIRILMACSRSVFEESTVTVPVHQRIHTWLNGALRKRHA